MHTCEYGYPVVCEREATWVCYPDHFPLPLYACDQHAPRMVAADRAHRLPSAPLLSMDRLKEWVTALAWQSVLLRGDVDAIRAENAHRAFQNALTEYQKRTVSQTEYTLPTTGDTR